MQTCGATPSTPDTALPKTGAAGSPADGPAKKSVCGSTPSDTPYLVFELRGEGEEGDIWAEYYVNGKMHRAEAEIRVAEFDPAKLA